MIHDDSNVGCRAVAETPCQPLELRGAKLSV